MKPSDLTRDTSNALMLAAQASVAQASVYAQLLLLSDAEKQQLVNALAASDAHAGALANEKMAACGNAVRLERELEELKKENLALKDRDALVRAALAKSSFRLTDDGSRLVER